MAEPREEIPQALRSLRELGHALSKQLPLKLVQTRRAGKEIRALGGRRPAR